MNSNPTASVIVPSFNHEQFVEAAVASVLAQTFADFELILVDDGSTDGSLEKLRALASEPRIRLIAQENRGAHAAIARGIEAAEGRYVFILNSDDRFAPRRLERLVAELERHPEAAATSTWLTLIDEQDREIGMKQAWMNLPPWPQPESGPSLNDLGRPDLALLQGNHIATTSNLAFRREQLPAGELLPLRYCHDWNLALVLARCGELRLVKEPLADYRVHPGNTLREGRDEALGSGRMRFEILWVVARHAPALLERAVGAGLDPEDLSARFLRSAPRFGRLDLLNSLLALASFGDERSLLELLDECHPFRKAAIEALAKTE